jgi:hypothetical protein
VVFFSCGGVAVVALASVGTQPAVRLTCQHPDI